jgi:hypothetical protein
MLTKMVPDNLNVRVDFADFWKQWADGAPLDTLTPVGLHAAKEYLLDAGVPPATAFAYFMRLAGIIANSEGTNSAGIKWEGDGWEHFHEIELIEDELQERIEY